MQTESIVLGGGCFWCVEAVFVGVRGIVDVESGYCNGNTPHVTYQEVCTGTTGHNEVIRLVFDSSVINLENILEVFFAIHDPTSLNRQGADVGTQYRSGIYYSSPEQRNRARRFIEELTKAGAYPSPILTEIEALKNYVPAEAYHQDFFANNPNQGYCLTVAGPKITKFRKTFPHLIKAT